MNRYLLLIYLVGTPIVALTTLYELGFAHLWSGYPFVWVNCLLILSIGPPYGQCGYYFDWFALLLDVNSTQFGRMRYSAATNCYRSPNMVPQPHPREPSDRTSS